MKLYFARAIHNPPSGAWDLLLANKWQGVANVLFLMEDKRQVVTLIKKGLLKVHDDTRKRCMHDKRVRHLQGMIYKEE